uniref:Uncharacterized protein n=1 Tax=Sphaerodactylus townsendi TaxID=933632 RepID=A0ACB8GE85_9SAUR
MSKGGLGGGISGVHQVLRAAKGRRCSSHPDAPSAPWFQGTVNFNRTHVWQGRPPQIFPGPFHGTPGSVAILGRHPPSTPASSMGFLPIPSFGFFTTQTERHSDNSCVRPPGFAIPGQGLRGVSPPSPPQSPDFYSSPHSISDRFPGLPTIKLPVT